MLASNRVRLQRILREAEGYLELDMPAHTLTTLGRVQEFGTFKGHALYLRGQALREQKRYAEAIEPLEQSADLNPSNIDSWLALGWCYKRTDRLDMAIRSLERAREVSPELAVVHYNLACYLSLVGEKQRALEFLSRAIDMEPAYRLALSTESDFDPIRSDPQFQALTAIIV